MGESEHFVQFYEDDSFLVESVGAFIGAGLGAGEGAIVIATGAHREALEDQLEGQGVDVAAVKLRGQFVSLDAAETLSQFMVDGSPDAALFTKNVGGLVARIGKKRRGLRAFGEMVALLWAAGNGAAAIRLEELWNDLRKTQTFSLFCAYPMGGFRGQQNGESFIHICKEHSRVIPAESYAARAKTDDERLRAISLLQQKAASLETEVAERKHAEDAVRSEQAKLSMAAAITQLGIWELDMVTNCLTCSDQCKAHFGLAAHEPFNYERFSELVHPDDRPTVQNALFRAIADGADYSTEYRVIDPAGRTRWIASMARCFHNGAHRMLGVTLDITERKRAAEILEQTVAERTVELQETIGELEAFSYSISHDMRAPLRSMQGYATILMQECGEMLSPECRGYLERITTSGERMDRLIQDVLTFSRVARTDFNLEAVDLDQHVRGIVDSYPNLQPPAAQIVIEGRLPRVLGNSAALTQCLSNLLGNAVKFVATGTLPRVRVWAECADGTIGNDAASGQSVVRLFIQDNGIGIAKDAQEKVFAIFQRLSKKYEGTGIGLAIVKKAAERMGGKVGVHSKVGHGSTFWLELKQANAPA